MENKSAVALKRKLEDKVTDADGTEKPSKAVKANHVATLAQSNDPFIEAIIDVQRASERAFAIGKVSRRRVEERSRIVR
jgi:hypothetical protein